MTVIMYNSRCLEEESTSQLGIKKTWACLVQFNVYQRKGGWPGLGGRQQSASCVCGALRGGEWVVWLVESQELALFLWSQQKSLFQPWIHCLISVSEAEGVRCHLRCPTRGTGCAAVPYPRGLKSSMLCFNTDMKEREESRERESNSEVIKVVKTCCSERIRCSSLSCSAFPLALAGVCLCCCHYSCTGLWIWLCVCTIPRNSGQWSACCAGLLWMDPGCQATLRAR